MAIVRSQYVTVAELNEILGVSTYTDLNIGTKIYEASELIKQFCFDYISISADDYTTVTAPNNLKIATAYQVQYNDENPNIDYEYAGASKSVSIGKTSESNIYGGAGSQEYRKIAPKAKRYLLDTSLGDDTLFTRIL